MSVALAIAVFATAYVPITAGHVGRVIAALGPFLIDEVLASRIRRRAAATACRFRVPIGEMTLWPGYLV